MKKTLQLVLAFAIIFASCKHDSLIPGGTPPPGVTPPPVNASVICFQTDVLPVFTSNCAKSGCHDAVTKADGLRFDNYTEIMKKIRANNPNDSEAWKVILETRDDKRMPPPPASALSKAQKDSIYKWIVQGALNTANCGTYCDTTLFTFSSAVFPVIQASCTGCHSGALASGSIDLSSYSTIRAQALNGKLFGTISHANGFSPMPQGLNKLTDCKITQIKKWIDAGSQNN
ncbi:MAG: hypothetical protein QM725_11910 [Lacibacter sp.]